MLISHVLFFNTCLNVVPVYWIDIIAALMYQIQNVFPSEKSMALKLDDGLTLREGSYQC